ncbi:hypothetical protein R1sor_004979 [Riccia sorocarpa]|uniref:Uncharacterized protein n=1 Tax=Riccia sorocarpa TaxID=122646 RepID=A0ABD3HIS0_9MARC
MPGGLQFVGAKAADSVVVSSESSSGASTGIATATGSGSSGSRSVDVVSSGIGNMDVLLVDTAPERNSRNHPYSGMHPRAVDGFPSASLAVEWLTRFTNWLTTWTENVLPTVDFVHAHRRSMDGIVEPIMVLRDFWEETSQPIDRLIIWSDRTIEEAPAEEAPHVEEVAATRVEGAPVEEAPLVEEVAATRVEGAPVEEATRVEEAPGQETTPVEEIPLAIPIPAEAIPLLATQE